VSKPEEEGYFELLMKRYTYGKMSSHLFDLQEGESLAMRGPVGRFKV
jgi:cytochrome-b5 reductase